MRIPKIRPSQDLLRKEPLRRRPATSIGRGIRVDCLGSDDLAGGGAAIGAVAGAANRWQTAPFITEWCQTNLGSSGADLFVQGEQQVRQYHVSMLSSGNFTYTPS